MQKKKEKSVYFSWREALLYSSLSPTTRHVLLTIGCHMNDFGESCYPSVDTITMETGLSKRSVVEHIAIAEKEGWIERSVHGFSGKGWKRHEYKSSVPDGGDPSSPPSDKVVTLVPDGGDPSSIKVVTQGHPSTSVSTSMSTSLDGGPSVEIDTTQDIVRWMNVRWDDNERTKGKGARRKFNPGPHPEQYYRQEESIGVLEYRRSYIDYIHGTDNRGVVNFAKMMATMASGSSSPRKTSGSTGKQKTIDELWLERHPELVGTGR